MKPGIDRVCNQSVPPKGRLMRLSGYINHIIQSLLDPPAPTSEENNDEGGRDAVLHGFVSRLSPCLEGLQCLEFMMNEYTSDVPYVRMTTRLGSTNSLALATNNIQEHPSLKWPLRISIFAYVASQHSGKDPRSAGKGNGNTCEPIPRKPKGSQSWIFLSTYCT